MKNNIRIRVATLDDYPIIQNLARFYVYELSRFCGFISDDWACPQDGLYESFDFKNYFVEKNNTALLIKMGKELVGFVLINKVGIDSGIDWNMGEFFILAKFQDKGIGEKVAYQIWDRYPGIWEISVIPENKRALNFWHKAVGNYTEGNYKEELKKVEFDVHQKNRIILSFNTKLRKKEKSEILVRKAADFDLDQMVSLSYQKRCDYEKEFPQFWRHATRAEERQNAWFKELLKKDDYVLLVAVRENKVTGFVVGHILKAPEVYSPGGLTLMVDDFCVTSPRDWKWVGGALLRELKQFSKKWNIVQFLIVSGAHDIPKRRFLKDFGLKIASEWYVEETL